MRNISTKVHLDDGTITRRKKDLRSLLNLNYLNYTNKTHAVGDYDLPQLYCCSSIIPDYIALYNQPGDYQRTAYTCVCFYAYDVTFDGINGLFNAIYYNDKKLLRFYKNRFKNVRFFISPDYSQFGDLQKIENIIRLWKARIVTLWFMIELNAIAIPNITYISEDTFDFFCSGLEECKVVAFSTKGHVRYACERKLLKAAVKYVVDNLHVETIVVYSVCGKDSTSLKLFQYAIDHGIRVVIPQNSLRERNQRRYTL